MPVDQSLDGHPTPIAYAIARHGPMRVAEGDLISRCLALYGEWAWIETLFILKTASLSGCERLIDIGANIGALSLPFANQFRGEVQAIEGSATNHAILEENARIADFPNLSVYRRTIPGINPGQDRRGIAEQDAVAHDVLTANRGAFALDITPSEFEGALAFDPEAHNAVPYVAKIDVEVSSLAALELLYRSRRPPLACFVEADEGFPSLARVRAIAPEVCAIPLVFPAYNPANHNNAPNILFGEACEFSILLCSESLMRSLEDGLALPLRTDQPNRIEAALAERLAEGLVPRVTAVRSEPRASSVGCSMAMDQPQSAPLKALVRRLKRRLQG